MEWDEEVKLTTTSVLGYKLDLKADFYALKAIKNCVPCGYVAWINSTVPVTTMSKF